MMSENFDDIIKDKLDKISSPIGGDEWSLFEKRMQADADFEHLDQEMNFDKQVKEKLSQHVHTSLRSRHWQILKEQLLVIEQRKQTVTIAKIMEVVAVLLIICTFIHLGGNTNEPVPATPSTNKNIYAGAEAKQQKSFVGKDDVSSSPLSDMPISTLMHNEKTNQTKSTYTPDLAFLAVDAVQPLSRPRPSFVSSLRTPNNQTFTPTLSNISMNNSFIDQVGLDEAMSYANIESDEYGLDQVGVVGESPLLPTDFEPIYSEYPESFGMSMVAKPLTTNKIKSISVFGCEDVNLINTPFDKLYSLASYNKEALNHSFGIKYGEQVNKFEWQTGLVYAKRDYQPALVSEEFGQFGENYFEISLNKISFDIIAVPFNLKYSFIQQPQWSTYFMVGASLNLITNAKYDIVETLKEGRPSSRFVPDEARLDEKIFNSGVLNGDTFKNNYFASVNFGFGIEKKINNKLSLYVEPSYHRQVLSNDIGIGPNKDKIHTTSLEIGLKTVLN